MTAPREDLGPIVSLINELDVSVETIEAGLGEFQAGLLLRERHFVYLLLLATGIERLQKIILHLRAYELTGTFLTRSDVVDFDHDLLKLTEGVLERCFTPEYLQRL